MTDEKSPPLFSGSIFNPTHHSLPFLVLFLAVGTDLVGKRRGGNSGLSVIAKNCQKLPKTPVGCTFMHHNSWLCTSQLPVVRARVGNKSIMITRQSMVITRRGNYTPGPASAATATAVRDNCLLCSAHDEAFYAYQPWKKMKSSLLKKTFFSNTVCPVGFFAHAKTPNGTF